MFKYIVLGILSLLTLCYLVLNSDSYKLTDNVEVSTSYHRNILADNRRENLIKSEPEIDQLRKSQYTDSYQFKDCLQLQEVIEIFLVVNPETSITSIELENTMDMNIFEISSVNDNTEFSTKIDGKTGEIIENESERLDRDEENGVERKNKSLDLKEILSYQEVIAIAEEAIGGEGKNFKLSLERELNITFWEIEFSHNSLSYEVKIDAKKGDLLEINN
ncbi:peptidase propeptide and YPEB domain protein [Enterococcus sp. C1]|uniref:PepSY domain-containing protein n=1 Tax=Enterococcus sp. C1 TaxID=1182762 RepID=UPI0002721936|nr:PepSY domain-containing protein [Enterococcus sp. C1]EJF48098.1 peptidase propeptide and YPEB domain protein [Enterococcus sp. C1]